MLWHNVLLELCYMHLHVPLDEDALNLSHRRRFFLCQVWFLPCLRTVIAEALGPALCPPGFADKAVVRYAEGLLPLGLHPYVSDYALGGAIHGSSLKEGGGRIKQVSSTQITHDMVLRSGPLFMASHVSEGWLPWGTPGSYRRGRPSLVLQGLADTQQNTYTVRTGWIPITMDVAACAHGWEVCRNQTDSSREVCLAMWHSLLPLRFRSGLSGPGSASREVSAAWQSSSRPEPSAHSLFYQSLSCGKGCEIWRESEEGSQWRDLNALLL